MRRTTIALAAAALLTVPAVSMPQQEPTARPGQAGAAQEKGQRGMNRLVGTYKIVSGKHGGRDIAQDRLGGRVTITADQMTVYDTRDAELYVIDYTIERRGQGQGQDQPQAKGQGRGMGRRITMKAIRSSREGAVGSTARGLIRMEQGKLTLIYDYGEGGGFPEGFEPKGDSQHLVVMERAEAPDSPSNATPSQP